MKATASLQLRIGRVVWHGRGAPDACVLEAALRTALTRALAQGQVPVAATELARASDVIAAELLPRLPGGAR